MRLHHVLVFLSLAMVIAACASIPMPAEQVTPTLPVTPSAASVELDADHATSTIPTPLADVPEDQGIVPATATSIPSLDKPTMDNQISLIVRLDFVPLASYRGTVAGLTATNPGVTDAARLDVQSEASQAYLAYANDLINAFSDELEQALPEAQIIHRYTVTLAGVSVVLPANQRKTLASLPGVVGVYDDLPRHTWDDTEDLQINLTD